MSASTSCILSKFYIKPQRRPIKLRICRCCILSKFYIKPQLRLERELARCSCILSKFYIKPQLFLTPFEIRRVVSYRNSTSNHNAWRRTQKRRKVVSYRNSTSNHNSVCIIYGYCLLYLIEILHQTTTTRPVKSSSRGCILSKFYIKPQPCICFISTSLSCILSKFYIKPQRRASY